MPRWLKISLKILGSVVALILILWIGLAVYVSRNKKVITDAVTKQLNDNLNGEVTIGMMEPSLFRGFPFVSLSVSNVVVRDSLWSTHRKDLLNAKEIFIKLNILSVLKGTPQIRNINISHGSIYLFVDSTGYSNTSVFKKKQADTTDKKDKEKPHINNISLEDVSFTLDNNSKAKLFQLNIKEMQGKIDYSLAGWNGSFHINTLVKNFAFNTEKGSYLKNKRLQTHVNISYDNVKRVMHIPIQHFKIGTDDFRIGGTFFLVPDPTEFVLHIINDKIKYRNATALVSPNISSKLNNLDFEKPVSVRALIEGKVKFRDTPLVRVSYDISDNTLIVPGTTIEHCSFKGYFINEVNPAAGRNDPNSLVNIFGMKGSWEGIAFNADTVKIFNLVRPVLEGRFRSKFALVKLNDIMGGRSFHFDMGNANVNLLYRAGIQKDDTGRKYIYGTVQVDNAAMTYTPRNLKLNNCSALIRFTGEDLLLQKVNVRTASTTMLMDGRIGNFTNLYYTQPEKILLDWHIRSPQINLNEFISFLGKRNNSSIATVENKIPDNKKQSGGKDISGKLDRILDESSVHMKLEVDKLIYKRFNAENIRSEITLKQSGIDIQNISLNHAGGYIKASGNIQQGSNNRFDINTNIDNVAVQKLFYAFDNFGQDAITEKNIKGYITTNVSITGNMRDNGQIVPRSMKGKVDFDLQNGELINFEPLQKIGRFVFRNRNLSNITFSKLKNTLEIDGNKIYIKPMTIESSAINIFLHGVYGIPTGTLIEMDIPLRNPKKDELVTDPDEKKEDMKKGIVLHLKAVDGEDGKVKIKWNKKDDRTNVEEQ